MQCELIETGGDVRLRTAELELGWSREHGALIHLGSPGGLNLVGHGPSRPGVDIALSTAQGWIASRSFARFLSHRLVEASDGVVFTIAVGLGPLKIFDHYRVRGALVERQVMVENVGLDDLRLYGVRLLLPNVQIGEAQDCRLEAPGNSVRPRVSLAVAATQRRNILPRRYFAPGLRGGSALEPAPTQGSGLLAIHGGSPPQTLLCWYTTEHDPALPYVEGADGFPDAVSLAHEVGVAGWLRSDERLSTGLQHVLLVDGPWSQARSHVPIAAAPLTNPVPWVADAPIYLADAAHHEGLRGLATSLPALAELGIGALVLRPVYLSAGPSYQILDLERINPHLGDDDDLRHLVEVAHAQGVRVLLDLALQGCTAGSRYLAERPEWFVRDETSSFVIGQPPGIPAIGHHPGVATPPGCYSLDWQNSDLQTYALQWALGQVEQFGIDGFRAVAPYSPALNWARRAPNHASDGAMAPLAWLGRLRAALQGHGRQLALLSTLPGPAYAGVCDGLYDYPAHHMFIHTALTRLTPAELGAYLDDARQIAPQGSARICFMESHDTCEINPLADGLRGSRLSRMVLAGMALCGYVPSLWSGQERGEALFVRGLLRLWCVEPTLRYGTAYYDAARCDSPQVLTVLREYAGRRLLGLIHLGPIRSAVTLDLPGAWGGDAPRDLLELWPVTEPPRAVAGRLRILLEPFSAYCLEA